MRETINIRGECKMFPNMAIEAYASCGHLYDDVCKLYCKKCHIMQQYEYINIRYPEMVLEKCKLKDGDL